MAFSLSVPKGGATGTIAPVSRLVRIDRRFGEQVGLAVRLVALGAHVAVAALELVVEPRVFAQLVARDRVAAAAVAGDERGRDHVVLGAAVVGAGEAGHREDRTEGGQAKRFLAGVLQHGIAPLGWVVDTEACSVRRTLG